MSFRPLVFAFAFVSALVFACGSSTSGGTSNVLSVTNYDTACQQASDCLAVEVGAIRCCGCPNAAINRSDETKYESDYAAAGALMGVCTDACTFCPAATPTCSHGTCELSASADGGK